MKLTLPPKTEVPPAVRPVVRLTLPGKMTGHTVILSTRRANGINQMVDIVSENATHIRCVGTFGGRRIKMYPRSLVLRDLTEETTAARAALVQGREGSV